MVMKAILEALDGVPEALHEHYVLRDGKYHLETDGMRTQADVDRINAALTKERNDHKVLRDRYAPLSTVGVELDVILDRVNRFPELEIAAAGKIDDKKLDELVGQRLTSKLAPVERELGQYKTQLAEKDALLNTYQEKERTQTIHGAIREASAKANLLPTAIEDAFMLGERMFVIDDTGRVVTKEGVGVTPGVEASVWLTEMQPKRQHWWPASAGTGAGGGGGRVPGTNPFSHEGWNLTQQGAMLRENRAQAEQMAKAAGTSIGGPRPEAKK